mmetsp:Transcript_7798/g.14869  ORF Transcript_7798/g.14869 Transcript_7798/m.14869 type:complete len:939 (+) Transcript_7798:56-2872(+)
MLKVSENKRGSPSMPQHPSSTGNISEEEGEEGDYFDEGDEGDEGDQEGDVEEEDEEEEPKLKYHRLGASVTEILKEDSAKCLVAHEKFLVLGTELGRIHILDLNGNAILDLKVHSQQINDISLDDAGGNVASCSNDGKVMLTDLWSEPPKQTKCDYYMPVTAVALPGNFSNSQMFATGGHNKQFIIRTKSWIGNKDNVLHAGEGPIWTVKWRGNLIAWANDLGVKIWDCGCSERIAHIPRAAGSPRADAYRCSLVWGVEDTLLIGWANSVRIGVVRDRSHASGSTRIFQMLAMFEMDCVVCGLAPFGSELCVLCYPLHQQQSRSSTEGAGGKSEVQGSGQQPQLRIMSWTEEELSNDGLPILGYQEHNANDYRLEHLYCEGKDSLFYIVSPKDIVVGRPRDADDHVTWRLVRGQYEEALNLAEVNKNRLKQHKIHVIAAKFLNHLFETGQYAKAAENCSRLLGRNTDLWEKQVALFTQHRQIKVLAPYIPTSSPQLKAFVYELVLNYFRLEDAEGLVSTLKMWPSAIYSIETIVQSIEDRLEQLAAESMHNKGSAAFRNFAAKNQASPAISALTLEQKRRDSQTKFLREALSILYIKSEQYSKAVEQYLQLGRKDVFDLVKQLNLFEAVSKQVLLLMKFHVEESCQLFVEYIDKIPMDEVVKQIETEPELLHKYLHAVFCADRVIGYKHHQLQVELYAKYEPDQLLHFLEHSNCYQLEDALDICQKKELYAEMVFLLTKMGDLKQALTLIIEKLEDVDKAMALVEEQQDSGLWEELINRSLDRPNFLSDLLRHVGNHYVDMPTLVRRIPSTLAIPDLKQALMKIFSDQQLQVSVRSGCNKILQNDCVVKHTQLYLRYRRAIKVESSITCVVCEGPIVSKRNNAGAVVVFFCKHAYHRECLEGQQSRSRREAAVCLKCSSRNKHRHRTANKSSRNNLSF